MNTKHAIKIVEQQGYYVKRLDKNSYAVGISRSVSESDSIYSSRQLIKLAKVWTSERQRTNIKKNLKWEDNKLNRSKTKELLHNEDYDKLSPKKKAKQGDIWTWD